MVKIRLSRTGRKNLPSFRVVVTPLREKRDSKVIEYIGHYNPVTKEFVLNKERAQYWLSVGAQPSDTLRRQFVKHGLIKEDSKKTFARPAKKKSTERKTAKEEARAKAAEVKEEAPAE